MQTREKIFMYNNLLSVSAGHAAILKEAIQSTKTGITVLVLVLLLVLISVLVLLLALLLVLMLHYTGYIRSMHGSRMIQTFSITRLQESASRNLFARLNISSLLYLEIKTHIFHSSFRYIYFLSCVAVLRLTPLFSFS
jgi:hypothetical protein